MNNKALHQLQMNAAWLFGGDAVHSRPSERVLWYKYRQTYDGAASEVDDVVDGNHLQVQHHLLGPLDGPWQDKSGAHVTGLLCEKKRKDKEGREGEETTCRWTAKYDGCSLSL